MFALNADYSTLNSDNSFEFNFNTGSVTHKALAGIDYSHFKQLSSQAYDSTTPINIYNPVYGTAPPAVYAPQVRQVLDSVGYYGQDQIRFKEWVSLVLGVRRTM